jgi:hypothetical protein
MSSIDYTITFDGGSRNNGSQVAEAYGSYHIQARDGRERIARLQFPTTGRSPPAPEGAVTVAPGGFFLGRL